MGNDGGDIPRRAELVKTKKKEETPNMESIAMGRSRFCNLTNQRLKEPLAIDRLGCIYNYENVLSALAKKTLPSKYEYIKKLSDVRKVTIEKAPQNSVNYIICPITNLEYNGFNKFYGLWTCGHILSKKAFKELQVEQPQNSEKKCVICETPYQQSDKIDLNLQGKQLEVLRTILVEKKQKKKEKKTSTGEDQLLGQPKKKIKTEAEQVINPIDKLGGEFRDVLRDRKKFRQIFSKEHGVEWKENTYTASLKPKQ